MAAGWLRDFVAAIVRGGRIVDRAVPAVAVRNMFGITGRHEDAETAYWRERGEWVAAASRVAEALTPDEQAAAADLAIRIDPEAHIVREQARVRYEIRLKVHQPREATTAAFDIGPPTYGLGSAWAIRSGDAYLKAALEVAAQRQPAVIVPDQSKEGTA